MEIYERIRSLRIKNNMTQKELGDRVGVSAVSIGCWENGSKKPSSEAIIALAKAFNVTTDYLFGINIDSKEEIEFLTRGERTLLLNYRLLDTYGKKAVDTLCSIEKSRMESMKEKPAQSKPQLIRYSARYIPRYTTPAAAGSSVPLDGDNFEMILVDDSVPVDADFAVGIQGDSMYPYIHDGDTVYVKKDAELIVGDVGIFSVDGEMYCKQYYLDEGRNLHLLSLNPQLKHTNVYVDSGSSDHVKCYGKVLLDCHIDLPKYIYED